MKVQIINQRGQLIASGNTSPEGYAPDNVRAAYYGEVHHGGRAVTILLDGQEIPSLPEPPKSTLSVGTRVIDRELRGDWVVRSIDTRTDPALVCCEPSKGTAQEKGNTLAETFRADELTICD